MNDNIDLGNMTSRQIGNMMSKPLVERGKEIYNMANGEQEVDYGDLPSRALSSLGKQAIDNEINQNKQF